MTIKFKISALTLQQLNQHLFSGDCKEAVAIILCGHICNKQETILLAHKVFPIPYDSCRIRQSDKVTWSSSELFSILNYAENNNLAVVKVHCHPNGYDQFSDIDDLSDKQLFPSICNWVNHDLPNLSAILLPGNKLVARHVTETGDFSPVSVSIIGDEVSLSTVGSYSHNDVNGFEERNLQVFGAKTRQVLRKMKVAVVGCSGTGAPVIEQLYRLGIGTLVLIDPDVIEEKNLNRITNSNRSDATNGKPKVHALKDNLNEIGLTTFIDAYATTVFDEEVVKHLASCDFIFGCVDSVEARTLLNRICNFYLVPYIDIGICLNADGKGGITSISGKIAYFQPGKSDHISRGSVLLSTLEAEALRNNSPDIYQDRLDEGYIKGVIESSPAIIPVNTYASSLAVLEFLARIHDYRNEPNSHFAEQVFCLVNDFHETKREDMFASTPNVEALLGRGDISPLLNMPRFSGEMEAA